MYGAYAGVNRIVIRAITEMSKRDIAPLVKGSAMYRVEMSLSCPEKYCEVLPSDACGTEMILEDLIRRILLDLFTCVKVDWIRLQFAPDRSEGQQSCLIQVQTRCAGSSFPLDTQHLEQMELVMEDRVSCALVQLLGMVEVERVKIMSSPDDGQKLTLL